MQSPVQTYSGAMTKLTARQQQVFDLIRRAIER
ncbi:MAG TPA: repressor LexA, partial [Paraburkholderia sp.]|nr:repressor LexA [Paraburkholderia sp.]